MYRVEYGPSLMTRLLSHIAKLSSVDRYGILADLSRSDMIPGKELVSMLEPLAGESSFVVWEILHRNVSPLLLRLGPKRLEKLKAIMNRLYGDSFEKVGKFAAADRTDIECVTQEYLGEVMGKFAENPGVLQAAIETFKVNIGTNFVRIGTRNIVVDLACAASKFSQIAMLK